MTCCLLVEQMYHTFFVLVDNWSCRNFFICQTSPSYGLTGSRCPQPRQTRVAVGVGVADGGGGGVDVGTMVAVAVTVDVTMHADGSRSHGLSFRQANATRDKMRIRIIRCFILPLT